MRRPFPILVGGLSSLAEAVFEAHVRRGAAMLFVCAPRACSPDTEAAHLMPSTPSVRSPKNPRRAELMGAPATRASSARSAAIAQPQGNLV